MSSDIQSADDDRVLYWPAILAVAGPLAVVLLWAAIVSAPSGIFVLIYLLILFLAMAAWASVGVGVIVIACLQLFFARAWRRALSSLILPLTVVVAGVNFGAIWDARDYIPFFLQYPSLRAEIEKIPADKPRLVVWGWQTSKNDEIGLAYDESDEIASDHPSEGWKKRANEVGIRGSGYRPLYGHFYLFPFDLTAGNAHVAR
jgi:hypothetical protein